MSRKLAVGEVVAPGHSDMLTVVSMAYGVEGEDQHIEAAVDVLDIVVVVLVVEELSALGEHSALVWQGQGQSEGVHCLARLLYSWMHLQ